MYSKTFLELFKQNFREKKTFSSSGNVENVTRIHTTNSQQFYNNIPFCMTRKRKIYFPRQANPIIN